MTFNNKVCLALGQHLATLQSLFLRHLPTVRLSICSCRFLVVPRVNLSRLFGYYVHGACLWSRHVSQPSPSCGHSASSTSSKSSSSSSRVSIQSSTDPRGKARSNPGGGAGAPWLCVCSCGIGTRRSLASMAHCLDVFPRERTASRSTRGGQRAYGDAMDVQAMRDSRRTTRTRCVQGARARCEATKSETWNGPLSTRAGRDTNEAKAKK